MKALEAWVARDDNGMLYLYLVKPIKFETTWITAAIGAKFIQLDKELFPEVQWSDEEPKKIKLSIMEKSKIKSALSFFGRIGLFVFILCCTVLGILHLIQWIIWQTLQ